MFGKKKIKSIILILTGALVLNIGSYGLHAFADGTTGATSDSNSSDPVINEKFGKPILVYGGSLTPAQRQVVRDDLNISDPSTVLEMAVTGNDLVRYIPDGDPRSNMYSSVLNGPFSFRTKGDVFQPKNKKAKYKFFAIKQH